MKKIIAAALVAALFVLPLAAKDNIGLTINAGAAGTVFSRHEKNSTQRAFLPGVDLQLKYGFNEYFGVYGMVNAAFGKKFSNKASGASAVDEPHDLVNVTDGQLGAYYNLNITDGLDVSFGLGLGIGGVNTRTNATKTTEEIFLVGGGLNIVFSYMLTQTFGTYIGISETIYTPVRDSKWIGNHGDVWKNSSVPGGKLAQSFNAKLGFQLKF